MSLKHPIIITFILLFSYCYSQCPSEYSFAVISDIHIRDGNDNDEHAIYARAVVDKINSLKNIHNIQYVFITGDVTDSAHPTAYVKLREILSKLNVRYIPIIGNHDTWIYNSTYNEPYPTGDTLFGSTFLDIYKSFDPREFTYQKSPHFNPDQNIKSWVQNWELKLCDLILYGLDWNSRKSAATWLGYKGAWPGAQLHDYQNGTFQFLNERLRLLSKSNDQRKIIMMHHHPYRAPFIVPDFIYGFSSEQKTKVREMLLSHLPKERYIGIIAGHWHRWFDGTAFDEWPEFKQWETEACKATSAFSLVHIKNGNIDRIDRLYGVDRYYSQ